MSSSEGGGFFVNNRLVKVSQGLESFNLASESEKSTFLRTLKDSAPSLPASFATAKILPSLVSALEFRGGEGGAGAGSQAATILPLVLQLGKNVDSEEEYKKVIIAPILKLYASPDRGIRMALLDNLEGYAGRLGKKDVTEGVWTNLQTGFSDTVPLIREATLKAVPLLSSSLSDRILNNDLLRHLARAQSDSEPSIRTNACILLGRLAPNLGYNTKRKVLVPAFGKALKDVFVHARVAALRAFMASVECFEADEVAGKVMPCVAPALVDKEKLVRDQAFKAIELFVKKLEQHASTMPETVLPDPVSAGASAVVGGANLPPGAAGAATTIATSAAGAAGALAGWAMSSLGKKLAASDMQSDISPARPGPTPSQAPTPVQSNGLHLKEPFNSSNRTASTISAPATPGFSSSRSKGLQLGASKIPPAELARQLAEEVLASEGGLDEETVNAWGTDDLMDVNADEGDWSAFESAPTDPRPPVVSYVSYASNEAVEDGDAWGDLDGPSSSRATPVDALFGNTTLSPQPERSRKHSSVTVHSHASTVISASSVRSSPGTSRAVSPLSSAPRSPAPTPASFAAAFDDDSNPWEDAPAAAAKQNKLPPVSLAGMSKEEKAAEMARRKEERKQRIAAAKAQKTGATK